MTTEEIDAIYRAHITPHMIGWGEIGSELRNCVVYPEDCASTIEGQIDLISHKVIEAADAIRDALDETDEIDASTEVGEAAGRQVPFLTSAYEATEALDSCDWPYYEGSDSECSSSWSDLMTAIMGLQLASSDW